MHNVHVLGTISYLADKTFLSAFILDQIHKLFSFIQNAAYTFQHLNLRWPNIAGFD